VNAAYRWPISQRRRAFDDKNFALGDMRRSASSESGSRAYSAFPGGRVHEVRAVSLIGFIEASRFVGLDPFELLRRARINPHFFDEADNRHAAEPVVAMLEEAAARSGCDHFGILMAECRSFASIGPLSLLLEHLPTMDDVVDALSEYRRLVNDIITLQCERRAEISILRWVIAPGFGKPQTIDLAVAMGYRVMVEASGRRWLPERIHFTHPAPKDLSYFRRFFSAELEFESPFNGYSCSTGSLGMPTRAPEPGMADNARKLLELMKLPLEQAPVSDSVQRAIALLLPMGKAALDPVAANLGTNPRALQRQLARESTSFAALLNETRRDLAQRYLAGSTHSIACISELSGFSSSSSFTRWFASEFGRPPSSWRQAEARSGFAKIMAAAPAFNGSATSKIRGALSDLGAQPLSALRDRLLRFRRSN
jgi:AraC-like DNA-binding protein